MALGSTRLLRSSIRLAMTTAEVLSVKEKSIFFYFFFLSCCLTAKHGERPQPDKPNPPASTASRHGVTHGW